MTLEKFLKLLRTAGYKWQLAGNQQILRTKPPFHMCPICAVANHIIGDHIYTVDNARANMHLRLPKDLFTLITSASDGWTDTTKEKKIRTLLIEATNPTNKPYKK